jgi:nitroreductase
MVADLDETLRSYGAAGYRHLLNQCGFVVGQIWLAASAAGLVGTACGIVIEEGMRNAIKSDGYTQASMFGFVLGEPEDKEKAG